MTIKDEVEVEFPEGLYMASCKRTGFGEAVKFQGQAVM
jgi:hypothetical protein